MDMFTLNKLGQIRQQEILDEAANIREFGADPTGLLQVRDWLVSNVQKLTHASVTKEQSGGQDNAGNR